jgi:polyvinyl alcohol dehydrogenase (cytochrome)
MSGLERLLQIKGGNLVATIRRTSPLQWQEGPTALAVARVHSAKFYLVALWTALAAATATGSGSGFAVAADWPMANHDPSGNHIQPDETVISAANVGRLAPLWTLTVAGIVNSTPAVMNSAVYFPDSGGKFWKIDAKSGKVIWSVSVPELTGIDKAFSRTSPAYADGMVFVADNSGAHLIAVDANTGLKRWITQLDAHPSALLTSSPVIVGDRIYMPVSSNEQSAAAKPGYACCTFRGSMVALDIHTGQIAWKTYTMPDNGGKAGGYSGGAALAIPAVDAERGIVYFATDHQYTQPGSVVDCLTAEPDDWKTGCYPPDARFNSIIALRPEDRSAKMVVLRLRGRGLPTGLRDIARIVESTGQVLRWRRLGPSLPARR